MTGLLALILTAVALSPLLAQLKAYRSVRGTAGKHVEAALPRVGDLVQKHAVLAVIEFS